MPAALIPASRREIHRALSVGAAAVPTARVHVAIREGVGEQHATVRANLANDATLRVSGEECTLDDDHLSLQAVVHPLTLVGSANGGTLHARPVAQAATEAASELHLAELRRSAQGAALQRESQLEAAAQHEREQTRWALDGELHKMQHLAAEDNQVRGSYRTNCRAAGMPQH